MTLDELRTLITGMQADAASASDAQLAEALDAVRAAVADARTEITPDTVKVLEELRDLRAVVVGEQTARAELAAKTAADAEALLAEIDAAEQPVEEPADGQPAETAETDAPVEQETPELIAASGNTPDLARAVAAGVTAAFNARDAKPATPAQPQGRSGRPAGAVTAPPAAAGRDAVTATVRLAGSDGGHQQGEKITSTASLAETMAHALTRDRGARGEGRTYVARVEYAYPESRMLHGDDFAGNYSKIEKLSEPQALVAAGGLCAPLENLYDVQVIGSQDRPVRDGLLRMGVDRGGIQYRPNLSAATSNYGAGVWTLTNDQTPGASKGFFVVECPGLQTAQIEAIYSILEFRNITARFDPESTAANVELGMIAHNRLAENRLLGAIAAGSKILSAPKVVGATRDILANLDKALAYYRNRHRINSSMPMTFILPGWVKSLVRADIARQMAAGDWMSALALADNMIEQWFSARSVSPVWHLDGQFGTAEVQTLTETGSPTGGTFTLTYNGQTTAAINYNATAATIQTALENLSNLDVGDVTAAGGPINTTAVTVTFGGGEPGNVAQMTSTSTGLTGGTTPAVTVTTTTAGGGAITVGGVTINGQSYSDVAAGGVLPGFPDTIDSLLFPTGTWMWLDGGSLDLGLVRDSTLNDRNAYRQFTENFEGTAFKGVESLRVVMTVQPTGGTAGTVDTSAIAD